LKEGTGKKVLIENITQKSQSGGGGGIAILNQTRKEEKKFKTNWRKKN